MLVDNRDARGVRTVAQESATVFVVAQPAARFGDVIVEAGGPANVVAGGAVTVLIG